MKLTLISLVLIVGSVFAVRAAVFAQTPPDAAQPGPDSMVIRGVAPVAAGATVWIEALDPVAIRGVECSRASTTTDSALAGSSRFSLAVNRACFANLAANLRVCWGPNECLGFEFESGRTLDLGDVKAQGDARRAEVIVPDTGQGRITADGQDGTLAQALRTAGSGVFVVGLVLVAGAGMIRALSYLRRPTP